MRNEALIQAVGIYIAQNYITEETFILDYDLDEPAAVCDEISCEGNSPLQEPVFPEKNEVEKKMFVSFECKPSAKVSAPRASKRKLDDLMDQLEETFSQRLLRFIDEKGFTDPEVYNKAYVDRRHFSKIRNDKFYAPNKKTVLAFAIALQLSVDEAKDLLQSAGFTLSRSSKTDIIVTYCLNHQIYSMFDINDLLAAYDQPLFL